MRFKKTILAGLLSIMLIPAAFAGDQPKTVIPTKSGLKKFSKLHEEKLAEAKAGKVDWVMIGDSITHAWGRDYKGTFAGSNLLNLGFPGDGTEHVLWRIQHGALDGISPKLVTLLIGTNNLRPAKGLHTPDKPKDVFAGIQAIVAEVRTRLPESKLMVFSIFPRGPQAANERVMAVNVMLPQLTDHEHVFHVDINATFLDDKGQLIEAYYNKAGVHLLPAGYAAWAKALQPLLEKEGLEITPSKKAVKKPHKAPKVTAKAAAVSAAPAQSISGSDAPFDGDPVTTVWFKQPAETYDQSLVLGNGRIGAMVWGDADEERIVLNEESVWSGSRVENNVPGGHKSLFFPCGQKTKPSVELEYKNGLTSDRSIRTSATLFGARAYAAVIDFTLLANSAAVDQTPYQ